MTVTFAAASSPAIPGYDAGRARRQGAGGDRRLEDIAQLASNESPFGPASGGRRGDRARGRGARTATRTRARALLRRRIAERYETDPAQVAVANGSCEILLAAALALCEPGAEIVYAWPSFSMYPHLAPLSGAREIRVPLDDGDVHDLDAMLTEVTAATQLVLVCNPNNPTGDPPAGGADRRVLRAGPRPRDRDPRRGLRRVPARRRSRRDRRPAPRVPQPGPPAHVQQGLRARRACGSATRSARRAFRAAVDAVRQPFSVNALAQAAAAEAIRHSDDVADRVERNDRRAGDGRGGRARARACDARLARQLLVGRARRPRRGARSSRRSAERGILVRAGDAARRPRPHPGHLRHAPSRTGASSTRSG